MAEQEEYVVRTGQYAQFTSPKACTLSVQLSTPCVLTRTYSIEWASDLLVFSLGHVLGLDVWGFVGPSNFWCFRMGILLDLGLRPMEGVWAQFGKLGHAWALGVFFGIWAFGLLDWAKL